MIDILKLQPNICISDMYETTITLNAWKEFQSRQGPYSSRDIDSSSSGVFKVFIMGHEVDYVKLTTPEHIEAIHYLYDNANQIRDAIIDAIIQSWPELKEIYEEDLSEIEDRSELKQLIGLSTIHVMDSDKDGVAYVGYELGCNWDEEHGIGIMMHKDRVIEVGHADTSFNYWITYGDKGTLDEEQERWNKDHNVNPTKTKPWWKVW